MKHDFVIFWSNWDLYRQSFSDIVPLENVQYIDRPLSYLNGLKRRLYNLAHYEHQGVIKQILQKISKTIINENFWLSFYFDNRIIKGNCIFIFSRPWVLYHNNLIAYLKRNNPHSKYVLFLCDLFTTIKTSDEQLNLDIIKQEFDLILSFDQNDCQKYGFTYHPLVFSQYRGEVKEMPTYDIFFLGQPKNRYEELIACFEKFWEYGLTTDICLIGVKPEDQVYKDKIQYSDGFVSYEENLQRTLHAKCELEIMQKGGTGYTQRMCEAIALDKKIVTNNPLIHNAPFYNPDYIFRIQSADDITKNMCEKIKENTFVDYHYKDKISPLELLDFIEERV